MDDLKVYFNNLTNMLVTLNSSISTIRRFGYPFLLWNISLQTYIIDLLDVNPCYLTDTELRRLHRRFGYLSVTRLQTVLERSGHEVNKMALEYLTKYCRYYQRHGQILSRFRFYLRDDKIQFNFSIIVDIFYIESKPVLHVVDKGTRYQAGR
jgi:hypothetical protein